MANPIALRNIIGKTATGGVGSVLTPDDRAFAMLLMQTGNAGSHAEINLLQQLFDMRLAELTQLISFSGWTSREELITGAPANSFYLPADWVHVNGRLLYVADPAGVNERVTVGAGSPPEAGTRTDLIFLEHWLQEVAPTGSTEDDDEDVYQYGGVGNSTVANDILLASMPSIEGSKESSRRIQMRWRIRAVQDAEEMTDATVLAQGGRDAPQATFVFVPDGRDPNLWVSGAGTQGAGEDLMTVNGRVYGIPIATLLRSAGDSTIDTEINDLRPVAPFNNRVELSGLLKQWAFN